MKTKPQNAITAKPTTLRQINVHARLSSETVEKLEAISRENNITRAGVIAIACVRIAKTGL